MQVRRIIVQLTAVVFSLYGTAFIVAPELLSQYLTGSVPGSASGLIDMRATYGGMSLGVGIFLLVLSRSQDPRDGVLGVFLLMLGMAGGRIHGMLTDGSANVVMYAFLALEIGLAVVAAGLLTRQAQSGVQLRVADDV